MSTQVPLHCVSPAAHETTHAPPRQTCPLPQALALVTSSQAPQLFRSDCKLMHWFALAGAAETNFQTTVPSVMLEPVPLTATAPEEVPSETTW